MPAPRRTGGPSCHTRLRATRCWRARAVILREGGSRFRFLELLAEIGRTQDFHAEEGIAARGVEARCSARVDQSGVHGHARSERPIQREAAPGLRRLGDEQALLGANGENDSFWHVETPEWTGRIVVTLATSVSKDTGRYSDHQPPETEGRMMISSPGTSAVSSPSRSRMWSLFTNKFTCRLTVPVSSQMPGTAKDVAAPVHRVQRGRSGPRA